MYYYNLKVRIEMLGKVKEKALNENNYFTCSYGYC